MDKIVYNLVYNRKGSLNRKGTALVQIEAYQGKKKKYFSTKVYLKPEQWDHMVKKTLKMQEDVQSFIVFYRQEAEEASLKESSRRNHLTTLKLLTAFKPDIRFTELTYDFLCSFERYLRQKGYHTNTIAKHMKHLKRYINASMQPLTKIIWTNACMRSGSIK